MAPTADEGSLDLDPPDRAEPPRLGRFLIWSLLALALVGGLAGAVLTMSIAERRASLEAAEGRRLEALARGRGEVLATWLQGTVGLGRRLTESDLVRLFAAEMALSRPGTPLVRSLADQLPYFQQLISDFAEQSGLVGAAVVGLDGRTFLSSRNAPSAVDGSRTDLVHGFGRRLEPMFSPVRSIAAGAGGGRTLVLDVLLPVPPAQPLEESGPSDITAVLVMTLPAADRLHRLLYAGPDLGPGDRVRLLQRSAGGLAEVLPGSDPQVVPIGAEAAPTDLDAAGARPFGPMRAGGVSVLAVGAPVAGVPWTLLVQVDAATALAPLHVFARLAGLSAGLVGLILVLAFGAFWWWRNGAHQREIAAQYRALAGRIALQRRLLASITNAMQETLSLKTVDGRYAYVNPAFAAALGRPVEAILGRSDAELLSPAAAAALGAGDREALAGSTISAAGCEVELHGRRYHLAISKSPLRDAAAAVSGIVTVARDETALVEQRRRREQVIRQTVAAFVRAIELRDPFLLGHTRRMQAYALAVGRRLDLDEPDLNALELAAGLSQVGKMFIPDEVLAKPGRHNEVEMRIMQRHVVHAAQVLAPIDFELPVTEAIGQMYERLDGSGYPKGLCGEQIGILGRILGVVDVYCARTAPRSYRDQISPGKALYHLATNPQRYDVAVISALADVVAAESHGAADPAQPTAGRQGGTGRDKGSALRPGAAA